jgi:hypothetical protein
MNHSVHTVDDMDIGDIFAINRQFIVVVRGFLNIHYYYIQLNKVKVGMVFIFNDFVVFLILSTLPILVIVVFRISLSIIC